MCIAFPFFALISLKSRAIGPLTPIFKYKKETLLLNLKVNYTYIKVVIANQKS